MKTSIGAVVTLVISALLAPAGEAVSSTNLTVNTPSRFTFTMTEIVASGWVPPSGWKAAYMHTVVQSEGNMEMRTGLSWPQTLRLGYWVQNPFEGHGIFPPPGGEVDYVTGMAGALPAGMNFSTEVRFIDLGGANNEVVGHFGDKDMLRLRLKLDRPFKLYGGAHTFTPSLTFYHLEPITYRPNSAGNILTPQLNYDFRPSEWLKATVGTGFLHDTGVNGGLSADVTSYWFGTGLRLRKKAPECWLNGNVQFYDTLNRPANRPNRSFNVIGLNLSAKF